MFREKIIIITGGSSGLGRELAKRLARRGAHLALVARDEEKLGAARAELLKASDRKIEIFSCDVGDAAAVDRTINAAADALGPPDMLINSAGILRESYFEKQPLETFREVLGINFFGTLHCIKAVLPLFRKKGEGRIVNISSMGGLTGAFGYSAYCSSKFAVVGLTETLRAELKPQNIKIHLVCPPEFDSPMVDELNTYRTHENRVIVQTMPVMEIDPVADAVISGIEKDRYLIIPGRATRMLEMTNRWMPSVGRALVDFRLKRIYKGPGG